MKLSKEARKTVRGIFKSSLVNGQVSDDRIRKAAQTLVERKPRSYVGILKELHRLVRLALARRTALVESATELSPTEVDSITRDLRNRVGEGLSTTFQTNAALIGGLRIRIGSDVYDGSVLGRLQLLEKNLAS